MRFFQSKTIVLEFANLQLTVLFHFRPVFNFLSKKTAFWPSRSSLSCTDYKLWFIIWMIDKKQKKINSTGSLAFQWTNGQACFRFSFPFTRSGLKLFMFNFGRCSVKPPERVCKPLPEAMLSALPLINRAGRKR